MSAANAEIAAAPAKLEKSASGRQPRVVMPLLVMAAYWIGWVVTTVFFPATFTQFLYLFWSPMIIAVVLPIWFVFFSRLAWLDRLWTVLWLAAGGGLAVLLCDRSMAFGLIMYALPVAMTAVVVWLAIQRGAPTLVMRVGLVAAALASWGYFTLIRVDGISGSFAAQRSWRWDETAEQKRLAELKNSVPSPRQAAVLVSSSADWPDFRGPARDGAVRGTHFDSDWQANPPRELWRQRIGPGWSSFATIGNVGFTQEQRGEEEAVICFDLETGKQIWEHVDKARFWEVVAGAGPRATPTFVGGKLYTQGASGRLNCLDAVTGKVIWSRDILRDSHPTAFAKQDDAQPKPAPPLWGFASSPLVTGGVVIAFAGGTEGKGVLAYDAETGQPKWSGGKGTHGYSSPQLATLDGALQLLIISDFGIESFEPQSGKLLWAHDWTLQGIFRVCQPHVLDGGRIMIGTPMSGGTRLISVAREGEGWKAAEEWTADDYRPYFNDFVCHNGFLYGFDGETFTCRDVATGQRKWKKGRYGHGQVLLAADQGLLVVVSEKGELALLEANPEKLVELGKFQALAGKTWNHPVIAGNKLLVRNAEEMACYVLVEAKPASAVE